VVAVRAHRESYRRRRRRVTERVVDQVEQHALQEERLSTDGHGGGRGALESPSLLLRNRFERLGHLTGKRVQTNGLWRTAVYPGLDGAQHQKVLGQAAQPLGLLEHVEQPVSIHALGGWSGERRLQSRP